jgi:hypothetical protein
MIFLPPVLVGGATLSAEKDSFDATGPVTLRVASSHAGTSFFFSSVTRTISLCSIPYHPDNEWLQHGTGSRSSRRTTRWQARSSDSMAWVSRA